MKKYTILLLAILGLASCSKKDFLEEDLPLKKDVIINQGSTTVSVNSVKMDPKEQIIQDSKLTYVIVCSGKCKVSINGIIFDKSGAYRMQLYIK